DRLSGGIAEVMLGFRVRIVRGVWIMEVSLPAVCVKHGEVDRIGWKQFVVHATNFLRDLWRRFLFAVEIEPVGNAGQRVWPEPIAGRDRVYHHLHFWRW